MKVFLDTNILVSAVATRGICADIVQTVLADHEMVLGETVLEEFRHVLRRKFQLPDELAGEMSEFLRREAIVIGNAPSLGVEVRDARDVPVLEEALAGEVDVLVTGDRDLLEIAKSAPVLIVSPRGFWDLLQSEAKAKEGRPPS